MLGNRVRLSTIPRRLWPGSTTEAQPWRCVEKKDTAKGVGWQDPKDIRETVHQTLNTSIERESGVSLTKARLRRARRPSTAPVRLSFPLRF